MRRVLVNDRVLVHPRTGVGQYLAAVAANWPEHPSVHLVGFYNDRLLRRGLAKQCAEPPTTPESVPRIPLTPLAALRRPTAEPGGAMRRLASATRVMRQSLYNSLLRTDARIGSYDAHFEPNNIPTVRLEPTVTTLLDLSVLELPQFHPEERVAFWRENFSEGVRRTAHWICISEATAAAMRRVLGIPRSDVTVVPLASRWGSLSAEKRAAVAAAPVGLPSRYVVCVGTLEPRKNLLRLLDAYAAADEGFRRTTALVLAGPVGWGRPDFWDALVGHRIADRVLVTGYLSEPQLAAVMIQARALVYPSLYEGFGLPPLEAMDLGVPTAVSDIPSLHEVCGSAGRFLNPEDTAAWTQAMTSLVEDGQVRDGRIADGRRQAAAFSWTQTARAHHDLLLRFADR